MTNKCKAFISVIFTLIACLVFFTISHYTSNENRGWVFFVGIPVIFYLYGSTTYWHGRNTEEALFVKKINEKKIKRINQ